MATLESKKTIALQAVKLGMDEEKALLFAEIDEEEMDLVKADTFFVRRLAHCVVQEEHDLLEQFDDVMEESAKKGFSSDIRWKLGILNPKRYGTRPGDGAGDGDFDKGKKAMKFSFNFKEGTATLENADNVEVFEPKDEPEIDALTEGSPS